MTPTDDLIGTIASSIKNILQNNIDGIDRFYTHIPDGPPETNAIAIVFSQFEVQDDTNGKLYLRLLYNIRYVTRRKSSDEATTDCYTVYTSILKVLANWNNLSLGGLCDHTTIRNGGVSQVISSGQVFMSLIVNLYVFVEMNIPTN